MREETEFLKICHVGTIFLSKSNLIEIENHCEISRIDDDIFFVLDPTSVSIYTYILIWYESMIPTVHVGWKKARPKMCFDNYKCSQIWDKMQEQCLLKECSVFIYIATPHHPPKCTWKPPIIFISVVLILPKIFLHKFVMITWSIII